MKTRKTFTLVELLVVVAVLGILAVTSIITYSSFTKKAKENNDILAVTDMNDAINRYSVDNKVDTLSDVYSALSFYNLLDSTTTNIDNRAYYWDSLTNKIIYADENYNVINDIKDYSDSSNWYKLSYSNTSSTINSEIHDFNDLFN